MFSKLSDENLFYVAETKITLYVGKGSHVGRLMYKTMLFYVEGVA